MLNLTNGIDSLTNFKRQTGDYIERLRETGEPLVLTVNGRAGLVVQDAEAYQKLVAAADQADRRETINAILAGLADVEAGRTKPARKALEALAKKYGLRSAGKYREISGAYFHQSRRGRGKRAALAARTACHGGGAAMVLTIHELSQDLGDTS